jgi:hypothetical protein
MAYALQLTECRAHIKVFYSEEFVIEIAAVYFELLDKQLLPSASRFLRIACTQHSYQGPICVVWTTADSDQQYNAKLAKY